jgi:hypothetical protein
LGDIVAEATIQIVRAAGDASLLFDTAVVDGAAPFLCAAVVVDAAKSLVVSFIDAATAAAAFLGPDEVRSFLPFIPTLHHKPVEGYRRVGRRDQGGYVLGQRVEIIGGYSPLEELGERSFSLDLPRRTLTARGPRPPA